VYIYIYINLVTQFYIFAPSVTYKKLEINTETTLRRGDECIYINFLAEFYIFAPSVTYKKLEINTETKVRCGDGYIYNS
jgi:hypothetical protein